MAALAGAVRSAVRASTRAWLRPPAAARSSRCAAVLSKRDSSSGSTGGSGDPSQPAAQWHGDQDGGSVSAEQVSAAQERDAAIRRQYDAMPDEYPEFSAAVLCVRAARSQAPAGPRVDAAAGYRKRLIYRSKQRGWLEVDLLLGSFAAAHVPDMSERDLRDYERLLNQETLDIYNYVSGREALPAALDTPVVRRLQDYAASSPVGRADPDRYREVKGVMSN